LGLLFAKPNTVEDPLLYRIVAWLNTASLWAIAVALAVCLPAIFIRKIRPFSGTVLAFCTWIWGPTLWLWCVGNVLAGWGVFWLVVGILLGGVGVIPVALICFITAGRWWDVGELLFQFALVWGGRLLATKMMDQY